MSGAPRPDGRHRSRAEDVAERINALARTAAPGARIGSRTELREQLGVSVGTLHEGLRLLQHTGEITVRTGPGGGVFAGRPSALADLLRGSTGTGPGTFAQSARILDALRPLLVADVVSAMDDDAAALLHARLADLEAARARPLPDVVAASLELFATVTAVAPDGMLRVVSGALLRAQLTSLPPATGPVDEQWPDLVEAHTRAARVMVEALVRRDAAAALAAQEAPGFLSLFRAAVGAGARDARGGAGHPTPPRTSPVSTGPSGR